MSSSLEDIVRSNNPGRVNGRRREAADRSEEDVARFRSMVALFQKYSDQCAFDWLLMAAQGYQESTLDQSKRSHVGAIGVMQVMPATAQDKAVGIPDIENLESSIHAGIKYNRWVADNFYDDEAMTTPGPAALRLRVVQTRAPVASRACAGKRPSRGSMRSKTAILGAVVLR